MLGGEYTEMNYQRKASKRDKAERAARKTAEMRERRKENLK